MRQKYSNTYITVHLDRIRHNLDYLSGKLQEKVQRMVVVKANAYGHGLTDVAKALKDSTDWFAVNGIDEGVELREAGIRNPILVFEVPDPRTSDLYVGYSLTATVSAMNHFEILSPGTEYHLNVDTGMGRLGLQPGQVPDVRQKMEEAGGLTCTGIYSHFATADEPGSDFASRQLEVFRSVRSRFSNDLLTHMCNTGGSLYYPEARFDLVRTGIGVYGYAPGVTGVPELRPALTLETRLVQVKPIKKGMPVSYGSVWQAPRDGYIGVLPVGYDDGIRRNLTGEVEVRIGESLHPVVGTITMNYCMVFLGQKIPAGEPVTILDGEELTAATWARTLQTIPYEILTGLSNKIPRIYE